jgi:hypothetical protein
MNEPEIDRMSKSEYREWCEKHVQHASNDKQVAIDAGQLYDRLIEGLGIEVVSSPKGRMSAHILLLIEAGRKLPRVDHVYVFQNTFLPNSEKDAITTVISVERLSTEFSIILADLIQNLI